MNKTGWPAPALMQDDDRKLFRWFASKPDARRRVREACEAIEADKPLVTPDEASEWVYQFIAFAAVLLFVLTVYFTSPQAIDALIAACSLLL